MKNILYKIYNFLETMRTATYAAMLARNGQIKRAQSIYRD